MDAVHHIKQRKQWTGATSVTSREFLFDTCITETFNLVYIRLDKRKQDRRKFTGAFGGRDEPSESFTPGAVFSASLLFSGGKTSAPLSAFSAATAAPSSFTAS